MMKTENVKMLRKKKYFGLLVCMIISAIYIGAVLCTTGIFFEHNDDRYMAEILSGVLTREPDAHVVHINYLLSLPLAGLYRIAPNVPWYGTFLILLHFIIYTILGKLVFNVCENWVERVIGLGSMFILAAAHIYMLGELQFTSTAAMLAVSGYVCLLVDKEKGKHTFFVLELLGFFLRENAMLMVQPIGMGVFLAEILVQKKDSFKYKCSDIAKVFGILCAVILIGSIGNWLGYGSAEWKTYDRINEARYKMFDFYGVPAYEDVKEILDKYQVSEVEYEAYQNYACLDQDISLECIEELVDYAEKHKASPIGLKKLIKMVFTRYTNNDYLNINRLTRISWMIFCIWFFVRKKWSVLLTAAGIIFGSSVTWGYFVWQGRMPWRVTMPMFFGETAILAALIIKDYINSQKIIYLKAILVGLCFGFCFVGTKTFIKQYDYVAEQNRNQKIFIEGMYEMQEYCNEHPKNRYLIDQYAVIYYRGSALDTKLYKPRNSVVSGSWYSYAPPMEEKLSTYFEGTDDNFRVIVYKDGNENQNAVIKYLEEKIGKEAVEEESFNVSHGGAYAVFKFNEE